MASVHHPATLEFFVKALEKCLSIAPIGGIVWDELKALEQRDYSPAAKEALKDRAIDDLDVHVDAQAKFFDTVNREALKIPSGVNIPVFIYGHIQGYAVERLARIPSLSAFGLDGGPFRKGDGGGSDSGIMNPPSSSVTKGRISSRPRARMAGMRSC